MLKKLLFGAGAAYLANRFMGGRRNRRDGYERSGINLPFGLGGSRRAPRDSSW